jgi:hypothetical protein
MRLLAALTEQRIGVRIGSDGALSSSIDPCES